MQLQINLEGLCNITKKIKSGSTIKCTKSSDNQLNLILFDHSPVSKPEVEVQGKDFKEVFEQITKVYAPKDSDLIEPLNVNDSIDSVLKKDFNLKIGSVMTVIENPASPHKEQRIFKNYVFSLSNGVLNSEIFTEDILTGIQQIAKISQNRYSEPEVE